jgi:putative sterol carrier protein
MNNEQKINKVIEWLYTNDHNCSSAKDWKEKFVKMLRETINENSFEELDAISSPFQKEIIMELEDHNFRINSDGWKKITVDGKRYLENPEKDVLELLDGECVGEQLFTYEAAMRETKRA